MRETQTIKRKSCLNAPFKNPFHLFSVPKFLVITGTFSLPNGSCNTDKVIRDGNASAVCSPAKAYCNKESLVFCSQ